MISFSYRVKLAINEYKPNEIIVMKSLFNNKFKGSNENLFYKVIERLCNNNELIHIGKGIYIRPFITKYGIKPITDEDIIDFYTKNNKGLKAGYSLYNNKGLTTQTPRTYKIYSNSIYEIKKKINNVEIIKVSFELNNNRKKALEILEILENYNKIENASYNQLKKIIEEYVNNYDDKSLVYVINNKKYKKSTIASLKYYLDKYKVNNSLNLFLSSLSKYKLIKE